MHKKRFAALAGLMLAAAFAVPAAHADDADTEAVTQQKCAEEFHAAVVEDNEAYNARDAERYEAVLNPRMIFAYDGVYTYGRDAIMRDARAAFAIPNWTWTYEILSETVYGCHSGIAVLEAHSIRHDLGTDREFAVTMTMVRENGKWTVAMDTVHLLPL